MKSVSKPRKTRPAPAASVAPARRSPCPLNASLEMIGDRWSLLILRDMMLRGARTYNELLACPECIATNILASRLRSLIENDIIEARADPIDRRKQVYLLTGKGIDLAPVMAELVLWAARHERTGNQTLVRQLEREKERMIAQVRQRWAEQAAAPKPNAP